MDDLLSEKEQIDQFRAWWSEYGAYVIGGIVIGAGLLFGYNYYQNAKLQERLNASTAYEALLVHVDGGDLDEAEAAATEIASVYGETTYAGQAGLAMARLYMDKNRDMDATVALQAVIDGSANDELKHVARLRMARIYLYQNKAQEVVDLLVAEDAGAFAAAYAEILGDAYAELGRIAEAEDAYQKILVDTSAQGIVDQQLVQWKVLDLPAVVPEAEELESIEPEALPAVEDSENETDSEEDE